MRAFVLIACLVSCAAAPPVSPLTEEDAGVTPLGKACAHLRAIRCSDGERDKRTGRTCFQVLSAADDFSTAPTACWIAAATIDAARACGSSSTLRVRCLP